MKLLDSFQDVLRRSEQTLSQTAEQAALMDAKAKKAWWQARRSLDQDMARLLSDVESKLFHCCGDLFMSPRTSASEKASDDRDQPAASGRTASVRCCEPGEGIR